MASEEEEWKDTEEEQQPPSPQTLARRTSVSLPNLEMLLRLQEHRDQEERALGHSGDDSDVSDLSDTSASDRSEDEGPSARTPLRRKSKAVPTPLNIVNSNFLKSDPTPSPAASIASINSLSSLVKERLVMTIPGVLKTKQPREYKLQAFVAFLFIVIVFLVGFAYVFYHQQVLQRAYFERIRFNQDEKQIRVFDRGGVEVLSGWLGSFLPTKAKGYPCLEGTAPRPGAVCIEWENLGRLSMHHHSPNSQDDLRCYEIHWQGLSPGANPTDCYDLTERKGLWYGGGDAISMHWPFSGKEMPMAAFITGNKKKNQWGNALQKYFINSRGAALVVSGDTPLYVSAYERGKEKLCLQARFDEFAYVYHKTPFPVLNYSICTAEDVRAVHAFLADKSLWDGLKKEDIEVLHNLLEEPVWRFSLHNVAREAVLNHTDDIAALGSMDQGYILLDEYWQSHIGDLTMDLHRFPKMEEDLELVRRRGFKIALTIQPFFSTDSQHYAPGLEQGIWVRERHSRVPALARYKSMLSGALLDMTINQSVPWLQEKLKALQAEYPINAFFLDVGTADDFPYYYEFDQQLPNPDHYSGLFVKAVMDSVLVLGTSSAIKRPRLPAVISMSPSESSWEGLQALIPTFLTLGTVGYPFIMPGAVGGDYLPISSNFTLNETEYSISQQLPPQELYIRWLELAHFLPIIQYSYLPSAYNAQVTDLARIYTRLRKMHIYPLLKKFADEALNTGLPVIRPLWMLDPDDTNCLKVGDEFSIGDELVVAPVVVEGAQEREIYLPKGVWKDGLDGSLRKGERWIHSYRVKEEQIAHFFKQPDGTRL